MSCLSSGDYKYVFTLTHIFYGFHDKRNFPFMFEEMLGAKFFYRTLDERLASTRGFAECGCKIVWIVYAGLT